MFCTPRHCSKIEPQDIISACNFHACLQGILAWALWAEWRCMQLRQATVFQMGRSWCHDIVAHAPSARHQILGSIQRGSPGAFGLEGGGCS